jgi:hypothetical protein
MINNFWMLLAQIMVASFVAMFAISFLLAPFFIFLSSYKEKRERATLVAMTMVHQLQNGAGDYTVEDFLRETKNK